MICNINYKLSLLFAFIPVHCMQTFLGCGSYAERLKVKNSPAPNNIDCHSG